MARGLLMAFVWLATLSFAQAQHALSVEVAWQRQDAALDISFATETGKEYGVLRSIELEHFVSLGSVRGNGERMALRLPAEDQTQGFYQVLEWEPLINFSILLTDVPEPTAQIAYGEESLQFGELRLPDGPGPHPVVVFVHGGCWLSAFDMEYTGHLEQALADEGYAVWSLEYRRVGNEGGGWPGTFLDIANGADHLTTLALENDLDLSRVVASGHSAGGQLALWLAARSKIDASSDVYTGDPVSIHGVLGLAPAPDLEGLYESRTCGHVINGLMGGSPGEFPERYANASPMKLAPIAVPQTHVIGLRDEAWTPVSQAYIEHAKRSGDEQIQVIEAKSAGHFELVRPTSPTWETVRLAFHALFARL